MVGRSIVLPLSNYATGIYELGPEAIADDVYKLGLALDRCTSTTPNIWPNSTTRFTANFEMSFDGGATWSAAGGFGGQGGIFTDKNGVEVAESYNEVSLAPPVGGVTRQLRVTVVIENGPLRTTGELLLTTPDN